MTTRPVRLPLHTVDRIFPGMAPEFVSEAFRPLGQSGPGADPKIPSTLIGHFSQKSGSIDSILGTVHRQVCSYSWQPWSKMTKDTRRTIAPVSAELLQCRLPKFFPALVETFSLVFDHDESTDALIIFAPGVAAIVMDDLIDFGNKDPHLAVKANVVAVTDLEVATAHGWYANRPALQEMAAILIWNSPVLSTLVPEGLAVPDPVQITSLT